MIPSSVLDGMSFQSWMLASMYQSYWRPWMSMKEQRRVRCLGSYKELAFRSTDSIRRIMITEVFPALILHADSRFAAKRYSAYLFPYRYSREQTIHQPLARCSSEPQAHPSPHHNYEWTSKWAATLHIQRLNSDSGKAGWKRRISSDCQWSSSFRLYNNWRLV